MTTENVAPLPTEVQLERLRELVSIGAGHAATAFGSFVGRTFLMRVPTIRVLRPEMAGATYVADAEDLASSDLAGIFFEVEGGLGGLVAILLPLAVRDRLLEVLLGAHAHRATAEQAESALRELGNILVSHVASAIGHTLQEPVLPSVPLLAMEGGGRALGALVSDQAAGGAVVRVETEIVDTQGELRALLVLVPDLRALAAERMRGATVGEWTGTA